MAMSDYHIVQIHLDIVFVRDMDKGRMSVTNDAVSVCKEIHAVYPNHRIVYRDSVGDWCELVHSNGEFIGYKPYFDYTPF